MVHAGPWGWDQDLLGRHGPNCDALTWKLAKPFRYEKKFPNKKGRCFHDNLAWWGRLGVEIESVRPTEGKYTYLSA